MKNQKEYTRALSEMSFSLHVRLKKSKILKFLQMSATLGVNRVISSVTLSA